MERKLLNYIMNPSLFLSWILGLSLVVINEYYSAWLLMKFFLVILMTIFHIYCAKVRRDFERGVNYKNQ